jgi:hypothetical protein
MRRACMRTAACIAPHVGAAQARAAPEAGGGASPGGSQWRREGLRGGGKWWGGRRLGLRVRRLGVGAERAADRRHSHAWPSASLPPHAGDLGYYRHFCGAACGPLRRPQGQRSAPRDGFWWAAAAAGRLRAPSTCGATLTRSQIQFPQRGQRIDQPDPRCARRRALHARPGVALHPVVADAGTILGPRRQQPLNVHRVPFLCSHCAWRSGCALLVSTAKRGVGDHAGLAPGSGPGSCRRLLRMLRAGAAAASTAAGTGKDGHGSPLCTQPATQTHHLCLPAHI